MKLLKRILWVGFTAAIMSGAASAQTTGGTTGGGATGGGGGGGGGIGNASLGGNNGLGNNNNTSTAGNVVTISPPSQVQTTNPLNASNSLGRYYANPAYQGRAGTAGSNITTVTNPGGFGAALYSGNSAGGGGGIGGSGTSTAGLSSSAGGFTGSTGTAGATGRTGAAGSTGFGAATGAGGIGGATTGFGGATTGRTGGAFGGTTGGLGGATGGLGGSNANSQQNSGMISPRPIAYTATYRFPVATITPTQQQLELRTMIDASSQLIAPKDVEVVTEKGGMVVLKGKVANEEEARLVEGIMRITPGVRDVKNLLTFPTPTPEE